VAGEEGGDFLRIFGILRAEGVGENGGGRFGENLEGQDRGEALARGFHQGRVEGAGYRDEARGETGGLQFWDGCLDCGIGAGNHGLAGAVVIGQGDAFHAVERFDDGIGIGCHGGHGSGFFAGGIFDGAAAGFGEIEQGAVGDHARGGEGDVLTVTVAGGHIGADAQTLKGVA